MASQSVVELLQELTKFREPVFQSLQVEQKVLWPGRSKQLWPQVDIMGHVDDGSILLIEVDDHGDPGRSVVKYWPLLHASATGECEYPSILFVEVFAPDSTFGEGYGLLAEFIGARFREAYPTRFRFRLIRKAGMAAARVALEIREFALSQG